ncbi:hypothetical protein GIB67_018081 [Kingdonia uniflora]|uniref:KIB1-4 beta-propeller domain-containing protein n=1 Tax=Kingdonia uniflora TaxID=39325 RepID=A0A7J7NWI2_9MAGN|nr:hypothetical protein GIB67_018081 [Kingdonia uniflora]
MEAHQRKMEWKSVLEENQKQVLLIQLPVLVVPTEDDIEKKMERSVYSISEKRLYDNVKLLVPHHKSCCGSSHGWLVTVDPTAYSVCLLNPFLRQNNEIQLPPVSAFPKHVDDMPLEHFDYIRRIVLSCNPTCFSDYAAMAMAIYSSHAKLAFCKAGDKAWTSIEVLGSAFSNILYYKDLFYAVYYDGKIITIDIHRHNGKPEITSMLDIQCSPYDACYLVETSATPSEEGHGELLLIAKVMGFKQFGSQETYYTSSFRVFKLDQVDPFWVEMMTLDGQMLFIGHNSPVLVSASDFPAGKPNGIYYTDDYVDGNYLEPSGTRDFGIFNLEDRSFEMLSPLDSDRIMPPPIWIQPTPQQHALTGC